MTLSKGKGVRVSFFGRVDDGVLMSYYGNYGLVRIPSQVTEIGEDAFRCYGSTAPFVTAVIVPDGVTRIGNDAFYGCADLQFLYLPDSLTEIGDRAFYQCRSLKEVTIPASVTKIGRFAFGFYKEEWEAWDVGQESEFTILGEKGSAAECYAGEHGFSFVPV